MWPIVDGWWTRGRHMFRMPELSHAGVEAARELRELQKDKERLDWLGVRGVGGRRPCPGFNEGFKIRNAYGDLLGSGVDLRAAIDEAMAKEPKCQA